jgi:hypothetical protein
VCTRASSKRRRYRWTEAASPLCLHRSRPATRIRGRWVLRKPGAGWGLGVGGRRCELEAPRAARRHKASATTARDKQFQTGPWPLGAGGPGRRGGSALFACCCLLGPGPGPLLVLAYKVPAAGCWLLETGVWRPNGHVRCALGQNLPNGHVRCATAAKQRAFPLLFFYFKRAPYKQQAVENQSIICQIYTEPSSWTTAASNFLF